MPGSYGSLAFPLIGLISLTIYQIDTRIPLDKVSEVPSREVDEMSMRTCNKKRAALLTVALSLFIAGCSSQGEPDREATPAPSVAEHVSATFDDVKAGKACIVAVVSMPVWIETDREYIGENGYCEYKE